MDLVKSLEKFLKSHGLIIIVALVVLFVGFNLYSNNKSALLSGFSSLEGSDNNQKNETKTTVQASSGGSVGSPISGINTPNSASSGNCTTKQISNPADLLPKDTNSEWAQLNPNGVGDLENVSLLNSGHHIGINTVGTSLRNANLQVRSEPVIPKASVGPWLNSTIEPNCERPKFEIGGPSC
jgi:hypothetical protein